jgi:dipeptidyl aminopeptidase/acylaminoacyl peptidase
MSKAYEPGLFLLYHAKNNRPQSLGALYPDLNPEKLGEVVRVNYPARDTIRIPAFITLPPGVRDSSQPKNLPFVVMPHGGPYGRDEERFDYFAKFFAKRGFCVLQMNFRGSEGDGKAYEESGRKNCVVMQEGVEDGTRWLADRGYADPERTCIVGWSYSDYADLMGALKHPELYACAISMAGVKDLQDMIRDIKGYRFRRLSAQNFVLKGFDSKDDIKANSPVKLASNLKMSLFLAHGTADQWVHLDQFRRIKRALRRVEVQVTYMEFKDEDHFLSNQKNRIEFFEGVGKFLAETLVKNKIAQ